MKDLMAMRIKLGDEQSFELLFNKFYVRLCGFANKFLRDPEQAQEIVMDVFIKIWEGREDIDPENSLKAYLFQITKNLSLNKLKRRQVESKYIEIYKQVYINFREFSADESLLAKELDEKIAFAISKLPDKCRTVFKLSRIDALKYNEIADTLHISVKTVETHMSKAFNILRYELREYLELILIALIIECI